MRPSPTTQSEAVCQVQQTAKSNLTPSAKKGDYFRSNLTGKVNIRPIHDTSTVGGSCSQWTTSRSVVTFSGK